jgi:hypothetical protein
MRESGRAHFFAHQIFFFSRAGAGCPGAGARRGVPGHAGARALPPFKQKHRDPLPHESKSQEQAAKPHFSLERSLVTIINNTTYNNNISS